MAIVNPTAINPYNGTFGALLVAKEAVQQTGEALTKADAIPVFAQTMTIDLGFAMEQPMLEDPFGTAYLGQVTSAKCTWSFEAPLYGLGTVAGVGAGNYNIVVPRFVNEVLATTFDVTVTNGVPNPTLALTPTANSDGVNDSFSMRGFFGIKGTPAGGASPPNAMLSAYLVGCRISKATISIKSDGMHRIKLEGLGVYSADWNDIDEDLTGNNWDAQAQEFIRGMGQQVRLQVNGAGDEYVANATAIDISVDFGAEAIMSDGALSTLGVGAIGLTKRDVAISVDPIWVEASIWSIFSVARAGGFFTVTSAFAYPSAYSSGTGAKGRGFKFTLPKVQFANTTPQRASGSRAKLDGVSVKDIESDMPLTLTLGSE
tara:strand:- start:416 stop:1534 length:1119 start_codon:yes stop_codon:yes gene_type:complete